VSNIRRQEPVKATIVLPAGLHRWLRHRAVDEDSSLQEVVVGALTVWAAQQGYRDEEREDAAGGSPDKGRT
jgi:hypothetical protein